MGGIDPSLLEEKKKGPEIGPRGKETQ